MMRAARPASRSGDGSPGAQGRPRAAQASLERRQQLGVHAPERAVGEERHGVPALRLRREPLDDSLHAGHGLRLGAEIVGRAAWIACPPRARSVRPSGAATDAVGREGARVGFLVQRAARRRAAWLEGHPERAVGVAGSQRAAPRCSPRSGWSARSRRRRARGLTQEILPPAHAVERRGGAPRGLEGTPRPSTQAAKATSALRTLVTAGHARGLLGDHCGDMPPTKRSNGCAPSSSVARDGAASHVGVVFAGHSPLGAGRGGTRAAPSPTTARTRCRAVA